MRTIKRTGFFRHFFGGFALGAVALVGVQFDRMRDAPVPSPYVASSPVTPIG